MALEWLALGLIAGWFLHRFWVDFIVWRTLREMVEGDHPELQRALAAIDEDGKERSVPMIACRLEEQDGMFYLYRADNNEFVAQGRTPTELGRAADIRYPRQACVAGAIDDEVAVKYRALKDHA